MGNITEIFLFTSLFHRNKTVVDVFCGFFGCLFGVFLVVFWDGVLVFEAFCLFSCLFVGFLFGFLYGFGVFWFCFDFFFC